MRNSSEDDEHISADGLGAEPACWSQIGHVTRLFGQLVIPARSRGGHAGGGALHGESGVGKEVFARRLHRIGTRADQPFAAANCAVHSPPTRERRDDIPLLMNHLLHRESLRHGRRPTGFTSRAVRAMLHYGFPGNIRGLQKLVERGVISAEDGAPIDAAHMFRREQLGDETLRAIGAHGTTLSRAVASLRPGSQARAAQGRSTISTQFGFLPTATRCGAPSAPLRASIA